MVLSHPRIERLSWGILCSVIVIRVVGLILNTVWLCDCLFREFKLGIQCKGFSHYPHPEAISAIGLIIISGTSAVLIFCASLQSKCPSFKEIAKQLLRKKYFYQLCVTLILVLIYDFMTILGGEIEVDKAIIYTCYMIEHITAFALMFTLNFVPKFVKCSQSIFKTAVYKLTLLLYSVENYVIYALGTIVVAYKLVAIPTCDFKQAESRRNISRVFTSEDGNTADECHDTIAITMLLLGLVAVSLHHTLAEFFFAKFFDEDVDHLGCTPMQPTTQPETINSQNTEENNETTSLLGLQRSKTM